MDSSAPPIAANREVQFNPIQSNPKCLTPTPQPPSTSHPPFCAHRCSAHPIAARRPDAGSIGGRLHASRFGRTITCYYLGRYMGTWFNSFRGAYLLESTCIWGSSQPTQAEQVGRNPHQSTLLHRAAPITNPRASHSPSLSLWPVRVSLSGCCPLGFGWVCFFVETGT